MGEQPVREGSEVSFGFDQSHIERYQTIERVALGLIFAAFSKGTICKFHSVKKYKRPVIHSNEYFQGCGKCLVDRLT